jgi:DNA-binding response OmpR family regulator
MRILIAEDDPVTLDSIDACLSGEGFTTVQARNGKEALRLWEQQSPDLVCLDIMMPEIDGYEVCRKIRAQDSRVPVLFLSAKNEEIDVVVGLELGADDFIRKPFGRHELLARVRTALRRTDSSARPAESFEMRGMTIFPKELRAEIDGETEVELTPREVSILSLLYERSGEAVHRDLILERCWGLDYFPESRTLDQHVAKLRKKVETDPSHPDLIETVRGVGYRYRS